MYVKILLSTVPKLGFDHKFIIGVSPRVPHDIILYMNQYTKSCTYNRCVRGSGSACCSKKFHEHNYYSYYLVISFWIHSCNNLLDFIPIYILFIIIIYYPFSFSIIHSFMPSIL